MPEQNIKSHPGTAAVLSFIFNGLGQIYNGEILKGLIIVLVSCLSLFVLVIGSIPIAFWLSGRILSAKILTLSGVLFFIGLICACIISVYSIFDAYRVAEKR